MYHRPRRLYWCNMIRSFPENLLGASYADGLEWLKMDLWSKAMQRVMMRAFDICKSNCVFHVQLVGVTNVEKPMILATNTCAFRKPPASCEGESGRRIAFGRPVVPRKFPLGVRVYEHGCWWL